MRIIDVNIKYMPAMTRHCIYAFFMWDLWVVHLLDTSSVHCMYALRTFSLLHACFFSIRHFCWFAISCLYTFSVFFMHWFAFVSCLHLFLSCIFCPLLLCMFACICCIHGFFHLFLSCFFYLMHFYPFILCIFRPLILCHLLICCMHAMSVASLHFT